MPTNSATMPSWTAPIVDLWQRGLERTKRISPEAGDALLYLGSAVFALVTIYTSANALYQVWTNRHRCVRPTRRFLRLPVLPAAN